MSETWYRLTSIHRGADLVELLAACCVDGIGVIARWERREDGGWDVSAMDTEGEGMKPVTDFHEGESVPPTPPAFLDAGLLGGITGAVLAGVAERARQRAVEGYDAAHDDLHTDGELAQAAAYYALPLFVRKFPAPGGSYGSQIWPWDEVARKPSPDNRKREIEKAVGLLFAEWERLDRAEKAAAGRAQG